MFCNSKHFTKCFVKFLEENIGEDLCNLLTDINSATPKAQSIKKEVDKFVFIKIKMYVVQKQNKTKQNNNNNKTTKGMERQNRDWEKIFVNCVYPKYLKSTQNLIRKQQQKIKIGKIL